MNGKEEFIEMHRKIRRRNIEILCAGAGKTSPALVDAIAQEIEAKGKH